MVGKGHSDEVSDINEDMLETGRKAIVDSSGKELAELCSRSSTLWKVELVSDEIGF